MNLIKNSIFFPFGLGLGSGFLSLVFFALFPLEKSSSWESISLITIAEEIIKFWVIFGFFSIFESSISSLAWGGISFGSGFFAFEAFCFSLNKEAVVWNSAPFAGFVHLLSGLLLFRALFLLQNQKKLLAILLIFFAILFHLCYNWIVFNLTK